MSRVTRLPSLGLSSLANGWGHLALYVCAMGTLGVSAVHSGYALSESIWHAAVENSVEPTRTPSRVEKFLAAKADAEQRAEPRPYRPVVALVRPDIHPAALAAAIDRTELASIHEYPEHHRIMAKAVKPYTRPLDVASWRAPAVQVAGIACLASGCRDSERAAASTDQSSRVETAALDADAAGIGFASSSEDIDAFETEPEVKSLAKPYRLGKGRASARTKPSRKVLTPYGDGPAIVKFFVDPATPGNSDPGYNGLRVAETPGDIIRRTLRGTI